MTIEAGGLPYEFRGDSKDLFVVSRRVNAPGGELLLFDRASGQHRAVAVQPPADLGHFQLYSAARIRGDRLVASAGWTEKQRTRNGFVFLTPDGTVTKSIGYGMTIRSIVVSPTLGLIAASIMSHIPNESTDIDPPPSFSVGVFDLDGKFLEQGDVSGINRYATGTEARGALRGRKPYVVGDAVTMTFPEKSSKCPLSVVVRNPQTGYVAMAAREKSSAPPLRDVAETTLILPPHIKDVDPGTLRMTGLAPVTTGHKTEFIAAWVEGGPDGSIIKSKGHAFVAHYGSKGEAPIDVVPLPPGTFVGELTATPDGRVYAILFTDVREQGWTIHEVRF